MLQERERELACTIESFDPYLLGGLNISGSILSLPRPLAFVPCTLY